MPDKKLDRATIEAMIERLKKVYERYQCEHTELQLQDSFIRGCHNAWNDGMKRAIKTLKLEIEILEL